MQYTKKELCSDNLCYQNKGIQIEKSTTNYNKVLI